MTTEIDDIVRVTITQESSAVSRAGFSTLLHVPEETHGNFATRTKLYSGADILGDLRTDGFVAADPGYLAIAAALAQRPRLSSLVMGRADAADASLTETMNAIVEENSDGWYGFSHGARAEADLLELAAWTESDGRHLYSAQTGDLAVTSQTAGNVLEDLNAQNYRRTFVSTMYPVAEHYGSSAFLARGMIADLDTRGGQITWANKTLNGIASDSYAGSPLSNAARAYIHGLNGNTYERRLGRDVTRQGWLVDGEFIDVQVGIDWLDARMTEDIFAAIASTPTRIDMAQTGIDAIELVAQKRLQLAVDNGILLDFELSAPTFEEVSTSERTTRLLRNLDFSGTIAGAIHTVQMVGKVSV